MSIDHTYMYNRWPNLCTFYGCYDTIRADDDEAYRAHPMFAISRSVEYASHWWVKRTNKRLAVSVDDLHARIERVDKWFTVSILIYHTVRTSKWETVTPVREDDTIGVGTCIDTHIWTFQSFVTIGEHNVFTRLGHDRCGSIMIVAVKHVFLQSSWRVVAG